MLRASERSPEPRAGARARRPANRFRWRRPPRSALIGGGVALALVIVGLFAIGPIVRARLGGEAERRNLEIEVDGVRLGFFSVHLRGVRLRPRGVPGIEARLDHVTVELGATLSPRELHARGGGVFVEGEPEDVVERLRALRTPSDGGGGASASRRALRVEDLSLRWELPSGGRITATGLRASRDERGIALGCSKCSANHRHVTVEVSDAELDLGSDGAPPRVAVKALSIAHEPPPPSTAPRPSATTSAEPAPPPLPALQRRGARVAKAAAPLVVAPAEPALPLPDLHALRARIATAVAAFAPRLPDGSKVDIEGLSMKLDVGGEPVAIGPGTFTLTRSADRVHVTFASAGRAGGDPSVPATTPLSIDADLPIAAGEVTARLAGGPVSLAALGVEEGTKGLTDVARGTLSGKGQLVLSAGADALTFDGHVALRSIALKQPRLSPEPLRGLDFSVSARGVLDDTGRLRVDDAQIGMGALHVTTRGIIEQSADRFAVSLGIDVAPAACQALLDSSPEGLLPTVRAARMGGTFGANVNLAFDTRTIDKLALDYRIDDQCRMVEVPRDLARDRFTDAFTYRTYKPDGTLGETTTGPGTDAWTSLGDISPFMVAAVLTTEDGAFFRHKGFNHAAIRSSVQANLKARRFVRGASTITMQLAKNLFLSREKTLSRKIEEVILTDYLEQIFRKDDMMELYLNVVEFGPDVYGIAAAADYYFGRKPEELNLAECFFLSSLLPSPIRYGKLRDKGEVPETWLRHLRTLMEIAEKNGKITSAELEEGLKEPITFVRPGEPRPEPRKPVTGKWRDSSDGDDAVWHPLD